MTSARDKASAIEPFWNRLGPITRYPLQKDALAIVIIVALLQLVRLVPVFGWVLAILVNVFLLKYAAEVLVATARGRMTAPTGYPSGESEGWTLFFIQVLLAVIALVGGAVFGILGGEFLATVWLITLGLGAPAALMSGAIDGSVLRALNPLLWFSVIVRIGWPYVVACLLYVVIFFSQANAGALIAPWLPLPLALIALGFLSAYATIVIFHLMGYLVWQHHEALGLEPDTADEYVIARQRDPDQDVLDEAGQLVADGKNADAEQRLAAHLRERGGSDAVHERYRRLLRLSGDKPALLAHAREYLNVLITRGEWNRAFQLWSETRGGDASAWPSDPKLVRMLVAEARARGRDDLVLRFASGFHKAFPGDSEVVRLYLIVAQVMVEKRNEVGQARAMLHGIRAQFPKSQWLPDIDAYLATLPAES